MSHKAVKAWPKQNAADSPDRDIAQHCGNIFHSSTDSR